MGDKKVKKPKKTKTPSGPASNCLDCAHHQIIADPDKEDDFCWDDKAVVCTKATNPTRDFSSKFDADHSAFRAVTWACRPHHLRKESDRPNWCPMVN